MIFYPASENKTELYDILKSISLIYIKEFQALFGLLRMCRNADVKC